MDQLLVTDYNGDYGYVPNPSLGDGVCNNKTNTIHCNYDGLDCCQSTMNTDFCHGEITD